MIPFTPSPELIGQLTDLIADGIFEDVPSADIARAAIAVIAPMVGEMAAKVAETDGYDHDTCLQIAAALRAHFGVP